MKSAKEMFEELGYEKANVINPDGCIDYFVDTNEKNSEIYFDKNFKLITKHYLNSGVACPITLEELQAINKQVEELHWNDTTVNIDIKLDGKKVMEAMRGGNNA